MKAGVWVSVTMLVFASAACTPKAPPTPAAPLTGAELIEHGHKIFQMNCISCHGSDPSKDGPVGPAIAGSSNELIEARVMRAEYPAGYKPKRPTRLMVALPHLQGELPAIEAYLQSIK